MKTKMANRESAPRTHAGLLSDQEPAPAAGAFSRAAELKETTMSKYTPGPCWTGNSEKTAKQHAENIVHMCDVRCASTTPGIESRILGHAYSLADAQLWSAAPELAEALGWIVEFCAEHPEWTAEQFPADSSEGEWLEAARAALAKAEKRAGTGAQAGGA